MTWHLTIDFESSSQMLLKAASSEIEAGHLGSKKIRLKAFKVLQILVAVLEKNACQDTLAFLFPGLVSGLSKALSFQGILSMQLSPF